MGLRIERTDGQSVEFGVASVPYRKSKALYRMRGCQMDVLAYFRNDEDAATFDRLLDFIVETVKGNQARESGGR